MDECLGQGRTQATGYPGRRQASGKRGFGPRVGSGEAEIAEGGGRRRVQVGARSPGCRLPVGLGGQARRERKEGGKNGGSKDEEPPPFHRSRLSDSRESSPGAPRPASAHVIPGPPLPPPLAREAASSALPSRGATTWPAPCWGAGSG